MALDLDRMIEEVEQALHELHLGRQVVRVKIEGEETEFNRVSIPQLEGYLAKLQARKAGKAQRGAIGFRFG